jgi:hypothetical protein
VKVKRSRHIRYGIGIMLAVVLISAVGFMLTTRNARKLTDENKVIEGTQRIYPHVTGNSCGLDSLCEPFYGMQFVYMDDLDEVRALGIEVIMTDLPHDGTPASWLAFLNAAQARGIRVVPWLWPQGWSWDGNTWQIDAQARLFVQTVAGHPALFAVYTLHEPYWNGCAGCGYSTVTQQALYSAIKAIADVPLYSEIGSISGWTSRGSAMAFADGVCDYCATWHYPFKDDGVYERDEVITQLTADLAVASERAPHSKVVWMMPTFEYSPDNLRMPSVAEMQNLASIVYSTSVAGAWWYPWKFNDLYSDYLFNHPEFYPTVKSIYEDYILSVKGTSCRAAVPCWEVYLPVIIKHKL